MVQAVGQAAQVSSRGGNGERLGSKERRQGVQKGLGWKRRGGRVNIKRMHAEGVSWFVGLLL